MAELIPPMIVTIEARIGQLEADMKKATDAVDKFGKEAKANEAHVNKFSEGIKSLGKTMASAFAATAIIKFLADSGKAAVEDQRSFALMEQQLRTTTGATHEQAMAINDQIGALSEMSGVVDDKIRPGFATLVRVTGDTTKAMELQKVAMDVSAGTGKDLDTVTQAMAKAYAGNAGALQRLVPGIKGATDQMGYLKDTFKGAAETAGNADPYARMNVALDKIKETLGRALLPLINVLAKTLIQLSPLFEVIAKVIEKVMKAFAPLIDQLVKALTPVFVKLGDVIVKIVEKIMPPLIKIFDKVLMPIISMLADFLVTYLIPYWGKLADVLAPLADFIATVLVKSFQVLQSILAPVWAILKPIIDGVLKLMGVDTTIKVTATTDETSRLQARYGTKAATPSGTGTGTGTGGTSAKKADPMVQYLKDTQKKILDARATYDKAVADANDKYGKLIKQYSDEMNSIIQQSMDRLRSVFASAVATDVGSIFASLNKEGNATADQLLAQLQNKLAAGQKLAENAAALSGMGYSQTFIEQVVAQGTDTGNAMAEALKNATPETTKALQETFRKTEVLAGSGMDDLAKKIYEKSGLATDELKSLFNKANSNMVQAQKDLQDALLSAANSLNDSLDKIETAFNKKLASMAASASKYKSAIQGVYGALAANAVTTPPPATSTTPAPTATLTYGANGMPIFNITNNIDTGGTPVDVAAVTANSIKFGLPLTYTGGSQAVA